MIKDRKIELSNIVSQTTGNIVSDMGGEKVMLSVLMGKYYNLGEIGGEIWGLIETPTKVKEIVNKLTSIYDVDPKECEDQVISFLEHLHNERLIEIK